MGRIGDLRLRVTLQAEGATSDDGGGYVSSWEDIASVWAQIVPLTGNEVFVHARVEAHVTHRITMRYRSDVTTAMRLIYQERVFNIRAVLNSDERNRWLYLLAEEGAGV